MPRRPIWRRGCRRPMRPFAPAWQRSPRYGPDFAPAVCSTSAPARARHCGRHMAAGTAWRKPSLVETSDAIRNVGKLLSQGLPVRTSWIDADIETGLPPLPQADLVTVAYVLDELPPVLIGRLTDQLWQTDRRHACRRRAGNAGRLAADTGGARPPYRGRRASCRALPAPGGLPACGARLVPFRAPRRPLPPAPAGQECRRAVGRREIHLHRRVEGGRRRARGARDRSAAIGKRHGPAETLPARWKRRRETRQQARRRAVQDRTAARLGRCGAAGCRTGCA